MSKSNGDQYKSQSEDTYAAESVDTSAPREVMERLHPSLRESFVSLPPAGTVLTPDQLAAIFGGDLRGLRALAQLVYQSNENE